MKATRVAYVLAQLDNKVVKRFGVSALDDLTVERVCQSALGDRHLQSLCRPGWAIILELGDVDRARGQELHDAEAALTELRKLSVRSPEVELIVRELPVLIAERRRQLKYANEQAA